jgi:hypothetical protein
MQLLVRAGLAAVLVATLGACSDDDDGDPPPVTGASTTTAPIAEAKALFVELVLTGCEGEAVPDPALAEVTPLEGTTFSVEDANGEQVLLDTDLRIVTSTDGPEGVLPAVYSFLCAPSVFVGTVDH